MKAVEDKGSVLPGKSDLEQEGIKDFSNLVNQNRDNENTKDVCHNTDGIHERTIVVEQLMGDSRKVRKDEMILMKQIYCQCGRRYIIDGSVVKLDLAEAEKQGDGRYDDKGIYVIKEPPYMMTGFQHHDANQRVEKTTRQKHKKVGEWFQLCQ